MEDYPERFGFEIHRTGDSLEIRRWVTPRWRVYGHLGMIAAIIFVVIFFPGLLPNRLRNPARSTGGPMDGDMFLLLLFVLVCGIGPASYFLIATLFDRCVVRVDDLGIEKRFRPLPAPSPFSFALPFAKIQLIGTDGNKVTVIDTAGQTRTLFSGLQSAEAAGWVAEEIQRFWKRAKQ